MNIKHFELPYFNTWVHNNFEFNEKIGSYYCFVGSVGRYEAGTLYRVCVSNYKIPTNVYAERCIDESFFCKLSDMDAIDKLKAWYNGVQKTLNEKWEAYIRKTYLG